LGAFTLRGRHRPKRPRPTATAAVTPTPNATNAPDHDNAHANAGMRDAERLCHHGTCILGYPRMDWLRRP